MTQRERPSSTAVSEAAPRPPSGHPSRTHAPDGPPDRPLPWEEFYRSIAPSQQLEIVELARRQGVVYSQQLPPAPPSSGNDRARQFLTRLFAGHAGDLEPVVPEAFQTADADLDQTQSAAVACALHTPDIYLLQGLPGTGKSRVVAEIVTQAARRGDRVLLLASTTAAIDRVLEQVARRDSVCAVRCLAADEKADALPAEIRALTFAERERRLSAQARDGARVELETAESRCTRLEKDKASLEQCRELAVSWQRLQTQLRDLAQQREQVAALVERDAEADTPLAAAVAAARQSLRDVEERTRMAQSTLEARRAESQQALKDLAPELDAIRPLTEAKQSGRWWTGGWWKATLAGDVAARLAEVEAKQKQLEEALAALDAEERRLRAEREQSEQDFRTGRQGLIDAELVRRRGLLDQQDAALAQDQQILEGKWQIVGQQLDAETPHPAAMTLEAVQIACDGWNQRRERVEQQLAFAREWTAGLDALVAGIPQQLVRHANVVAGTFVGVGTDKNFGDNVGCNFDLLILEDAQQITESEFVTAARRARRWVLVGEPELSETESRRPDPRPAIRSRGSSSRLAPPRLFHRLWQYLHCDPRQLTSAWSSEGDRLCCRMREVSAEQRQWLECERVADFPEIELRILALPRSRPALVEVVFPVSFSIVQAKEYIFRELQELPVQARGHSLRWNQTGDKLTVLLGDRERGNAIPVQLEHGVRELVAGGEGSGSTAWYTVGLEFDRAAGWSQQRAVQWVERHLNLRDLGRTARLDVPYRMHPELAALVSEWLFAGAYQVPRSSPATIAATTSGTNGHTTFVEFVSVPPLVTEGEHRRPTEAGSSRFENGRRVAVSPRPRVGKGGAGLELDLSDARHRDRLPSELRPILPAHGLVNYLEAQAVVRMLERLVANPTLRAVLQRQPGRPVIGVLALYPAQAELIRAMVKSTPALAACDLDIRVDVPAAFRERECHTALISLTRSHAHRAVAFGEAPQQLALALTRARAKLILFGDAGTLARRAQWEGTVDHLDEKNAARERELVGHLVRFLHGDCAPTRAFQLHEGNRS
ncbi:MAG: AAA family ATPase [Gemmataceae bacterium]|nr:AAA family ATPase [Gemmataceae bacterium]